MDRETYIEKIADIAKLQLELLKAENSNSLSSAERYSIIDNVSSLRQEVVAYTNQTEKYKGIYWWDFSYYTIKDKLNEILGNEYYDGYGWRYESELCVKENDNHYVAFFIENGVKSDFTTSGKDYAYDEISKYTKEQQLEMVNNCNKRIDAWESFDAATTDGMVYSKTYDKVYNSASDYYNSFEHQMARQDAADFYASSLYQIKVTITQNVGNNSKRYGGIFNAGSYRCNDEGRLTYINILPAKLVDSFGPLPPSLTDRLPYMSTAVWIASCIAQNDRIKKVPVSLFVNRFTQEEANYDTALQNAIVFTLLADKLSFEGFIETQQLFIDKEDQDRHLNLINGFVGSNGTRTLTLEEATTCIDLINRKMVVYESQATALSIKALLYATVLDNAKDDEQAECYARVCSDMCTKALSEANTEIIYGMLLSSSLICGKMWLDKYQAKDMAANYADKALTAADNLRRYYPSSQFLIMEKQAKKLYKASHKKGWLF